MKRLALFGCLSILALFVAVPGHNGYVGTSQAACVQSPPGLVSWWSGDQDGRDISGANNNATLENGAIAGVSGLVGGAFQFNGINQYLATPMLVPPQGTIDLWVKPMALDSIDGIFATFGLNNGDDRLWLNARGPLGGLGIPPNHLVVNVGNCCFTEINVPSPLVINTWTHLALTFDYVAHNYALYINGQLAGSFTGPRNLPTQPLEFGTNRSDFGQNFFLNGLIDEVDLFNRVLDASEILAIFNAGSAGKCKVPEASHAIPGLFNTGVENGNALLPDGAIDPHYTLTVSADSSYPGPDARVVKGNEFPIAAGPWISNGPNSKWIGPRADAMWGNVAGYYTYRTTFNLTGLDPTSASIVGQWTMDNNATDILINGVSTGIKSPPPPDVFTKWYTFTINSGFVTGLNTLDFLVYNVPDSVDTPTGLRVELSGTANAAAEPSPPTAKCHDVTVVAGSNCTATASIDNGSYEPNGNAVTLTQTPAGPYSLGTTPVTLTVTDSKNPSSQSTCNGTVTVADKTPPAITMTSVDPAVLWPANHRMVDVKVNYNATDNCASQPTCTISGVTSNEPITASYYSIVDAHHVQLKAERSVHGEGRTYMITITCNDASQNSAKQTVTVSVSEDNQFQIFAQSRMIGGTSVLVSDWNAKAYEMCGGDFLIVSRQFNSQGQGYFTLTGIISCE